MSTIEGEDALVPIAATAPKKVRRRLLRAILTVLTAQYSMVAVIVSLTVAATFRYLVTPQIVDKFEAISAALKRWPVP